VAPSVVITALLAGLARLALDYAHAGGLSATGIWFGGGWLLGGLLAASLLRRLCNIAFLRLFITSVRLRFGLCLLSWLRRVNVGMVLST